MSLFRRRTDKINFSDSIRQEQKFLIWQNDDFFLRESYKTTRTNVIFSLAGTEGCKVIGVTSSLQSEGKSISASNLAMSFADTGARVLIIDCDLRKPKLSRLLNSTSDNGLTNVLMDNSLLNTSIMRVKEGKNLWLLSAGSIPPNPSELLGSEVMQSLIEGLRSKFDYIIVDTPPVDMVTDALVISKLVDGMLFVVRAGQSDKRAFLHTIEQMEYSNTKILGIIFNGSESAGGGYGYKRYGYRRYGYSRYGYSRGYGYGNGYGYGYGYGYKQQELPDSKDKKTDATSKKEKD